MGLHTPSQASEHGFVLDCYPVDQSAISELQVDITSSVSRGQSFGIRDIQGSYRIEFKNATVELGTVSGVINYYYETSLNAQLISESNNRPRSRTLTLSDFFSRGNLSNSGPAALAINCSGL